MKEVFVKLFAVLMMCAGFSAFASDLDAVVVSATGKVEVQNGSQWVPVKEGDVLKKGSVIQTGFKSELVLKVKESTMKVSQLTRMVIENLVAGADKDDTRIFVDTGSVRSDVNRSENRKVGFTVRSPVATASVRGTIVNLTNEFRGAKVETERGTVVAWPTTVNEAVVEEDQAVAETSEENASAAASVVASQSIENAPVNSIVVTKTQTTGFAASGTVTTAQSNARANTTVTSSVIQSASVSEAVATASTTAGGDVAASISSVAGNPVVEAASVGSLSVTVKFED